MFREKTVDFSHIPVADDHTSKHQQHSGQNWKKSCHHRPLANSLRFLRSIYTSHSMPMSRPTAEAAQTARAFANEIVLNISAMETGPKITNNMPASRRASAQRENRTIRSRRSPGMAAANDIS